MFYKFIWFALHFPCAWSSLRSSHMGSFHYRTSYYTCDAVCCCINTEHFIHSNLWWTSHWAPLQSKHALQIMHIVYHSLHIFSCLSILFIFFTDCVSLAPSPAIPVGFTQLIIGRSCCRGSNSLKFSLRIYWWDHTHVEHCLPIDGDSSLQWGCQALTLW